MANIRRIEVVWSGLTGLPGVSIFHAGDTAAGMTALLRTYFNSIADQFPIGLSLSFPSQGELINDANGEVVGTWTDVPVTSVTGTGGLNYAAGVGTYTRWLTAGVVEGRRVQGRTFLCPLASTAYDSSGTLTTATVTDLQTAAQVLTDATPDLLIWSRGSETDPTGTSFQVVATAQPDKVSWLRSRRD